MATQTANIFLSNLDATYKAKIDVLADNNRFCDELIAMLREAYELNICRAQRSQLGQTYEIASDARSRPDVTFEVTEDGVKFTAREAFYLGYPNSPHKCGTKEHR